MNKICTSIEQSKKLIELGIDVNTADMMWEDWRLIDDEWKLSVGYYPEIEQDYGRKCYPAWSLAALLDVLPSATLDSSDEHYYRLHSNEKFTEWHDNPVDVCYEMIIKLNELKFL